MNADFDVTIMGGGLAGLSLAIQIKNAQPEVRVLLVDKLKHPVPEAAFKVGESSSESSAHYFANILGMKQHLDQAELRKLGLRFYFTAKGNHDLTARVEAGPSFFPKIPGYQLDRGRFENHLIEECRARSVTVREGASARDVILSDDPSLPHSVIIQQDALSSSVTTRWVVDASGRSGLIRRKLGLDRKVGHGANASWFRIKDVLAVESWSDNAEWQAKVPDAPRSLSTTHLMGRGYWVWLIRLGSGSTSVGIVADGAIHPIETINTFERSLQWLRHHEPQCAREVESRLDKFQDFLTLKQFAHSASRVYSHHRWCLTGDAGPFTDPLYSPGSDFIGFGNSYITDLIIRDLRGENLLRRVELYNRQFLSTYESFLSIFEGRYPIMGNAQIMIAKVVWDYAAYWTNIALLFFRQKLCDFDFMTSNLPLWEPMLNLNRAMQEFFSAWNEFEHTNWKPAYIDIQRIPFLYNNLHVGLGIERSDEELRIVLEANARLLDDLALEFARHAIGRPETLPGETRDLARFDALCAALPFSIRERYLKGDSCPAIGRDLELIWLEEVAARSVAEMSVGV